MHLFIHNIKKQFSYDNSEWITLPACIVTGHGMCICYILLDEIYYAAEQISLVKITYIKDMLLQEYVRAPIAILYR